MNTIIVRVYEQSINNYKIKAIDAMLPGED